MPTPRVNADRVAGLNINPGSDDSDEEAKVAFLQGMTEPPAVTNIDRALEQITDHLDVIQIDIAEDCTHTMKGCVTFEAADPDDPNKNRLVACFFGVLSSGVHIDSVEITRTKESVTFKGNIPFGHASEIMGEDLTQIANLHSAIQTFLDEELHKTQTHDGFVGIGHSIEISIPQDLNLEAGFVDPVSLRAIEDPLEWHAVDINSREQSDLWTLFCFVLVKHENELGVPVRGKRTRMRRKAGRNRSRMNPQRRSHRTPLRHRKPFSAFDSPDSMDLESNKSMPSLARSSTATKRTGIRTDSSPRRRQRSQDGTHIEESIEASLNQQLEEIDDSFDTANGSPTVTTVSDYFDTIE